MNTNSTQDELDNMFPTWFKKIQVTFSGELPISVKERQQVFVVPYPMFEVAIETLIQRRQLEELETCLRIYTNTNASGMQVRADLAERIEALKGDV